MKLKKTSNYSLTIASLGLFVALAPLACSDDDDDNDNDNTGGKATAGTGGKATAGTGGKATAGTGGKTSMGGSGDQGGEPTVGDGGDDGLGGAGGAPAKARVRVIHASPNAPNIDIYTADATTAAASDVGYGDATDFVEVDAGLVALDLRAAGDDAEDEPAFTTEEVELSPGADYSFVAAGDFADADDPDVGFRVLALEHDFEAASADHAVARIVHATTAWAEVDLDLTATTDVDLPGLVRFGSESNVELPAAAAIDLSFADSEGTLSKLTLPELTEGEELTVIATGNPGLPFRAPANGFALLVVDQDGNVAWVKEQPWLHMVHAGVSAVDVYDEAQPAADAKLLDNLVAGAMGAFQLPASDVSITLKAVADDAADGAALGQAFGVTGALEEGEHYLSYIAAETGETDESIHTVHEQFDLEQPTKALLRGVHAAADIVAAVDFGPVVSGSLTSALIANVAYPEASAEAGAAMDPGDVILGAAATGLLTPILAQKTLSGDAAPVAGERDFVLLAGTGELWFVNTSVPGWSLR